LVKFAAKYSVEPAKMMDTLKATAFKVKDSIVTNEQMMALIIVADQYGLNPFTKEIFAFPDKGGIVPVVGVDGWARIINEHAQFDGMTFSMPDDGSACTCVIYRKDRGHAISVTEYLAECKRGTQPWTSHPRRMLRHKAMIQCARMAFGFAGIYDPDEADRIRDMGAADEVKKPSGIAAVKAAAASVKVATIDNETGEITGATPGFDYAAAMKRITDSNDREVLALWIDELSRALPECPDTDALLAAYRARDEVLAVVLAAAR
jgi:phage recombination protein Bet